MGKNVTNRRHPAIRSPGVFVVNKALTCIVDKINYEIHPIDDSSLDRRAHDYIEKNREGYDFINWDIGINELIDAYIHGFVDGTTFYCDE